MTHDENTARRHFDVAMGFIEGKVGASELALILAQLERIPSTSFAQSLWSQGLISEHQRDALAESLAGTEWADPASAQRTGDQTEADPLAPTAASPAGAYDLPTIPSSRTRRRQQTVCDFGDRFKSANLHDEGGIGRVWKVRDPQLGRRVALKDLRPEYRNDPDATKRFRVEARLTSQLEHPAIVPVYELLEGTAETGPYYTMRFVEGRTLAAAIGELHQSPKKLRNPRRCRLIEVLGAVCNAVAFAHTHGVIHRDLKPANILVGSFGEVVVLDWGLAKQSHQAAEGVQPPADGVLIDGGDQSNDEGLVMGTAPFMAPEQARGETEKIDQRTDVYALGAILYAILTGVQPYQGKSSQEIISKVIEGPPPRPRARTPGAVPALEAICLKAMEREQADRYQSALDLAAELHRWLADEPVEAHHDSVATRVLRWTRHHRAAAISTLTGLLGIAVASLVALGLILAEQQRTESALATARNGIEALYRRANGSLPNLPGSDPIREAMLRDAFSTTSGVLKVRPDDGPILALASELAGSLADAIRSSDPFQALQFSRQSVELSRKALDAVRPSERKWTQHANLCIDRAGVLMNDYNVGGATAFLGEAEESLANALKRNPRDEDALMAQAVLLVGWGTAAESRGDLAGARAKMSQATTILAPFADGEASRQARFKPCAARTHEIGANLALARLERALGNIDAAAAAVLAAEQRSEELFRERMNRKDQLRRTLDWEGEFPRARAYHERGSHDGDVKALDAAIKLLEPLVEAYPRAAAFRLELAEALARRAELTESREEATASFRKAAQLLESQDYMWQGPARGLEMGELNARLARYLTKQRDLKGAEAAWNKCLEGYSLAADDPSLSDDTRAEARRRLNAVREEMLSGGNQ